MPRTLDTAGRTRGRPSLLPALACAVVVGVAVGAGEAGREPLRLDVLPAAASTDEPWVEHDAPAPVRVRSDAVDIEAPTIPLGKRDDGALEVPEDAATAGWWTGRAEPGEGGPAVIVGHVDSREGPGAFWELPELEVGDRVSVDREDGTSVHWRVERVEQHPKEDFPTDAVYGDTDAPTLRLVTCSGSFDTEARRYTDNTIVFLHLDPEQDLQPEPAPAVEAADSAGPTPRDGATPALEVAPVGRPLGASGTPPAGGDRRTPILLAATTLVGSAVTLRRAWGPLRDG